jgi:hypothetical protein
VRFVNDEKGQSVVVVSVFMALIGIGFLAFALDVGSLFRQKRMAQAAADAAAVAAAREVTGGNSTSNEQTIANTIAKLNGFDTSLSTNPATVALTTPTTGTFKGAGYVQATVTRSIPTIFLSAVPGNATTMAVSATAIAGGGSSSPTCVCIESSAAQDLFLVNGAKLNAPNCGVIDNSSASNAVTIEGGSTLTASALGTVSTTWNNSGNINNGGSIASTTNVVQGISSTCAPSMPAAPSYTGCVTDPGNSGSGNPSAFTAGPASSTGVACYNGLTIGANNTIDTLNPGIYVINGGYLHFKNNNSTVGNYGGNGVFFYLANGAQVQIDQGSNVNLTAGGAITSTGGTAPSVGSAYDGILMYQAPTTESTDQITVAGGSNVYMNGALFAPSAQIIFSNGTNTVVEGGIVCSQLIVSAATLNANASVGEGTTILVSPKLVQ